MYKNEARAMNYQRKRSNPPQDQPRPSKPPEKDNQVARPTRPSAEVPQSDSSTRNFPGMKLDVTVWFSNSKILVLVFELERIPSVKNQIE